jgi:lysyl-tRNA synthetase class 2
MPSRAIRAFIYDPERYELTVRFSSGADYIYSLVPPGLFAALSDAPSKGAFHNARIRDRYPYRRISGSARAAAATLRAALIASAEAEREADGAGEPEVALRSPDASRDSG